MEPEDTNTTDNTIRADEPVGYTDDTHVMRYLLHTIKGISPVSGGDMQDDLSTDYVADEIAVE